MLKNFMSGLVVFAVLFSVPVQGQSAPLSAGARVRLTSPADKMDKHVTTVTELRGDSIVVAGRSGSRTIAMRNVTSLDVSAGTRNRVVRNGLIGLGAGALIGGVAGAATYEECSDQIFCIAPLDRGQSTLAGAAVFGAAGLVVGAVIGVFDKTDRWERRELPLAVSISPTMAGGATVKISKAF